LVSAPEVVMARSLLLLMTLVALPASAAEDPRVSFLEQEVRNLHRQLNQLSRRLDSVTNRPDRPSVQKGAPPVGAPGVDVPQWIDAARWRQVRPGMSELEVIGVLGAPTSMRDEDGARVLLYALEIGTSGFLGGSVTLRERVVSEVRQPVLQ
jgi:hypothetical protein